MKVKVKAPFFDENGIHKVGEIAEVKNFRPEYMELVEEKKEKVEKAVAKAPKKTTRKKV
jgi:hypothetical protein